MLTNVTSGPFVNEQGQLDLTLAREEDSMFYLCIGVDVAGANASQLFRVEVIVEGGLIYLIQITKFSKSLNFFVILAKYEPKILCYS